MLLRAARAARAARSPVESTPRSAGVEKGGHRSHGRAPDRRAPRKVRARNPGACWLRHSLRNPDPPRSAPGAVGDAPARDHGDQPDPRDFGGAVVGRAARSPREQPASTGGRSTGARDRTSGRWRTGARTSSTTWLLQRMSRATPEIRQTTRVQKTCECGMIPAVDGLPSAIRHVRSRIRSISSGSSPLSRGLQPIPHARPRATGLWKAWKTLRVSHSSHKPCYYCRDPSTGEMLRIPRFLRLIYTFDESTTIYVPDRGDGVRVHVGRRIAKTQYFPGPSGFPVGSPV